MRSYGYYVKFTFDKDGDLVITLNKGHKREIKDMLKTKNYEDVFIELIEDYLCNGWEIVTPESIGALTDALILSNEVVRDDYGEIMDLDRVYSYDMYAVRGYIDPLLEDGKMIWRKYDASIN
jgi:hypothetical protein